ncbi:MAG: sulfide/dihydroorotate dehydrogenase-like FAD/NAD-binding protein [Thermoguttaceae bacterium]|nr:sulfide/dihydroorotate dehydrogenase-like FAD/NAD-binding protein [Thermoguttaceae bacterium]MDW8036512.1 sulfide/dihydroorotate dehydrogenase-like FAD/NAD-binding protein [Thermoguttaceae bacterium]
MSTLLARRELAPKIYELVVESGRIARKAQPGQFVVVMAHERAERIPLTIADADPQAGTITLVVLVAGASTLELSQLRPGQSLYAIIGPLGKPSQVEQVAQVVMVAGGVGTAPIYPIARAFYQAGSQVITIQGARTKELLFWTERLASVSHRHIITTDDGSFGRRGLVTEPLREVLQEDTERQIGCIYAIGPAVMMKNCVRVAESFARKIIVSLNPIMVDGTGMCGGCRVEVGGQTFFACVDGPEFDGRLVNWDLFISRQKLYHEQETCLLMQYSPHESEKPSAST